MMTLRDYTCHTRLILLQQLLGCSVAGAPIWLLPRHNAVVRQQPRSVCTPGLAPRPPLQHDLQKGRTS